jgi:hypothetical protein
VRPSRREECLLVGWVALVASAANVVAQEPWLPSPPVVVATDEQPLPGAPVLRSGSLPRFQAAPSDVGGTGFDDRRLLPEGSGSALREMQLLLADDQRRRRLLREPSPADDPSHKSDEVVDTLVAGMRYEAPPFEFQLKCGADAITATAVQAVSLIRGDMQFIRALDRDYIATKAHAGGDDLAQIYPIADSYIRCKGPAGRQQVFIAVCYRYQVPSGWWDWLAGGRSRAVVFALRIRETLDPESGVFESQYYASDPTDSHRPAAELVWLSGRDYYLPVRDDFGEVKAFLLVTQFGWDLRGYSESTDELLADVHRNHSYFAEGVAALLASAATTHATTLAGLLESAQQGRNVESLLPLADLEDKNGLDAAAREHYRASISAGVPDAGLAYALAIAGRAGASSDPPWLEDRDWLRELASAGLISHSDDVLAVLGVIQHQER